MTCIRIIFKIKNRGINRGEDEKEILIVGIWMLVSTETINLNGAIKVSNMLTLLQIQRKKSSICEVCLESLCIESGCYLTGGSG